MAISPQYENFSFVGSKEDLFTKYKRKCTTKTVKQKRSKIITFGVVLFLLLALIIGLSVGLHVQKTAEKNKASETADASNNVDISGEDEAAKMNRNASSIASTSASLIREAEAALAAHRSGEKLQIISKHQPLPCSDESNCP